MTRFHSFQSCFTSTVHDVGHNVLICRADILRTITSTETIRLIKDRGDNYVHRNQRAYKEQGNKITSTETSRLIKDRGDNYAHRNQQAYKGQGNQLRPQKPAGL